MEILALRFYIELKDNSGITAVVNAITKQISPFAILDKLQMGTYWKIPEYTEVKMELIPKFSSMYSFQKIIEILGTGWETQYIDRESWSVWNFGEESTFVEPMVRWAILQQVVLTSLIKDTDDSDNNHSDYQ